MQVKRIVSTLLVLASVLVACVAAATTVVKLDFDQLVDISDAIVVGKVASMDAVVNNGRVFTHIDIEVRETLKGDVPEKFRIVHIGGRTNELATRVHGMPSFRVGELALLFVEQPSGYDHYVVTGLSQGKIALTEVDGELVLKSDVKRLHAVDLKLPTGDAKAANVDRPVLEVPPPRTLEDARKRIQALLKPSAEKSEE